MRQIADPKLFSFDVATANNLSEMEDMRSYAVENSLMYIEPTRLNNIQIRLSILNPTLERKYQRIRVFFFKNLATYQSSIIEFNSKEKDTEYSATEDSFWSEEPFIVEAIGFSPFLSGLMDDIRFKIRISKK